MNETQIIKKMLYVLLIIIVMGFIINQQVSASFIHGADSFISDGGSGTGVKNDGLKGLSNKVYNILLVIGMIVAVIIGLILGIQFMTGSIETKSKVKESLIPYVAGCVVIFGAFGIWKLVVTILNTIS